MLFDSVYSKSYFYLCYFCELFTKKLMQYSSNLTFLEVYNTFSYSWIARTKWFFLHSCLIKAVLRHFLTSRWQSLTHFMLSVMQYTASVHRMKWKLIYVVLFSIWSVWYIFLTFTHFVSWKNHRFDKSNRCNGCSSVKFCFNSKINLSNYSGSSLRNGKGL